MREQLTRLIAAEHRSAARYTVLLILAPRHRQAARWRGLRAYHLAQMEKWRNRL